MLRQSPFLTGFPTLLSGRARRSAQERLRREREQLHREGVGEISAVFADEIAPELVARYADTPRTRVYSQEVTFWAFLWQVLCEDGSCANTVARVQQWNRQRNLPAPSANTSSYVEARQRLPSSMLQSIHQELFKVLSTRTCSDDLWRGHRVKAIDATSAQMPDTAVNQKAYPQPSGQSPGCGFPVVQLVGLIDLIHGGLENFVESPIAVSELRGFDLLLPYVNENEILVGDRAYSSYEAIARLRSGGAHFVGRPHHSRKIDFCSGEKLGRDERLAVWKKPAGQPPGSSLSSEEWNRIPEWMEVRIIRVKGPGRDGKATTKYLVTTLLDPLKYPAEEIASLYFHRWEIEVRFRDIKTTLSMEMLRTQSPGMVHKELLMHMIAYNAIRLLMLKSAQRHGENARRLSFKGTLQVLASSGTAFRDAWKKPVVRRREKDALLERIAERPVPERPGRNEPRRVKRRPKCSSWLQQPRRDYHAHFQCEHPPRKILDEAA